MTPRPRDTFDCDARRPVPNTKPRWRDLIQAILVTVCALIVIIDHTWASFEKLRGIKQAIGEGQIPNPSWVVFVVAATIALAVVAVKDWTELRHHFYSYVAMARHLCRATWKKVIRTATKLRHYLQ